MELEHYRCLAREQLGDKRYQHTLSVTKLAGELAEKYGEDENAAQTAALLHDITKEIPLNTQLQMIKNADIIFDNVLLSSTNVYHSITAFLYARDKLSIQNLDILNAIRYHTTGRMGMSQLEKIIYIADATSYERKYPDVSRLRALAFKDLNSCIFEILIFTVKKLLTSKSLIAGDTIYCYNDICQKIKCNSSRFICKQEEKMYGKKKDQAKNI